MKKLLLIFSGGIVGVLLTMFLVNSNNPVEQTLEYEDNKTELPTGTAVLVTDITTHKIESPADSADVGHKLPQVPTESGWKDRLCKSADHGCELHLESGWETTLVTENGSLRSEPAGVIMQSKNFVAAIEQLQSSKSQVEDYEAEDDLARFTRTQLHNWPGSDTAIGCKDNLCLVQIDTDKDNNIEQIVAAVLDASSPYGTLTVAPVYQANRLKIRIITKAGQNKNSDLIIQ
jgi:hypothetical protein